MSTEAKTTHTPGPWEWAVAKSGITFDEEGGVYPPDAALTNGYQYSGPIAVVAISGDAGGEANGRLIAASPDLLAACEMFLEDFEQPLGSTGLRVRHATVDAMRAAIAQAKQ